MIRVDWNRINLNKGVVQDTSNNPPVIKIQKHRKLVVNPHGGKGRGFLMCYGNGEDGERGKGRGREMGTRMKIVVCRKSWGAFAEVLLIRSTLNDTH